ncbi:MAG: hypothetical protein A2151_07645 [Candidatus Muproteobacteria bacterium RBG_16_65_34]|uniref:Solute-binding protein family 3/N-terminal domain-containing protein n=1 Tax=Candidatus Muproteobacteria bacterium RBG_16_65_34 TaxID=1817760 RepID=A0A1F6TPU2_9PROT|nr:MAG: hypothetical protein A2151_07645 [Candidatus Muproteobacteria bacterium RBG_16_65_34]
MINETSGGTRGTGVLVMLAATLLLGAPGSARAADIRFAVQPILSEEQTYKAFQPLAEYIANVTGKSVELKTAPDFTTYWYKMKQGKEYNLVLDAPFYTEYRMKNHGFVPLVKVPGLVSYSLVAHSSSGIMDVSELTGKKIATLIPPAPGGLMLARLFPNPSRQPYLQPVNSSEEAMEMLLGGEVMAAMVPTPLVARAMAAGKDIATITTSPQTPHITLSASSGMDEVTREKIKKALLEANKTPQGQEMLKKIGFPEGFEPAPPQIYKGYSDYLKQTW